MNSKSFLSRLSKFLKARYAPRGARVSFAGSGEDLIIGDLFKERGIKKVSYIDIGAHHPVYGSNTYLFYRNGGQGVLIEPSIGMGEKIKRKRPRDVFVEAGVGSRDGEKEFYSFTRNTRNTFSKDEALSWGRHSAEKPVITKRRIVSLDTIVKEYCGGNTPNFISIDTEGYEMEILSSFSWKHKPEVFCVEVRASSGKYNSEVDRLMGSHGYELVARTKVNSIFAIKNE